MNLYSFVKTCQEEGLSAEEAEIEFYKAKEEEHRDFMERYYDDPRVNAGWAQQDMIDMRRRER